MAQKFRSIALVFIIFLVFYSTLIQASEIKEVRYYSDKEKTRIVLQLNEPAQYKTSYDKDHSLNISVLKSEIGTSKNIFKINDGLIDSVELKKINEDNININISLDRPATFNVFPLESPARIVIDASPFESIINPEVVVLSDQDIDDSAQNLKESQVKTINYNRIEEQKPISKESAENNEQVNKASNMPFDIPIINSLISDSGYGFLQIGFDIIILISLLYMVTKMKESFRIVRLLKKNRKLFKENPIFASILEEIEKKPIKEKKRKKKEQIDEEDEIQELNQGITNDIENEIKFPKQYEKVQEFAQKGLDPISIAQKSDIPVGEVNLILDLIKARKETHAH